MLEKHGYRRDEANTAALTLLPDILRCDRDKPAHYPNGRDLKDDVFSTRVAYLTHGAVTSQGLQPHDDLLSEFPFLGVPNPSDSPQASPVAGQSDDAHGHAAPS